MAKSAEDPPSPVDAYEAPLRAAPAKAPSTTPGYYAVPVPATPHSTPGELNDLAVLALIASCIGLSIPGLVMGHIALSQIKKNGQTGHGFALAAVIVGWAITVLVLLAIVAFIVFMVFVLSAANSAVNDFGNFG